MVRSIGFAGLFSWCDRLVLRAFSHGALEWNSGLPKHLMETFGSIVGKTLCFERAFCFNALAPKNPQSKQKTKTKEVHSAFTENQSMVGTRKISWIKNQGCIYIFILSFPYLKFDDLFPKAS